MSQHYSRKTGRLFVQSNPARKPLVFKTNTKSPFIRFDGGRVYVRKARGVYTRVTL